MIDMPSDPCYLCRKQARKEGYYMICPKDKFLKGNDGNLYPCISSFHSIPEHTHIDVK
jgi:hypothetical protein